jgi:Zn-dependent protease
MIPALVAGLTIHEFAHAWSADKLGDGTPRSQGRLTLDPLAHLDPIRNTVFLHFGFGRFGLGWRNR